MEGGLLNLDNFPSVDDVFNYIISLYLDFSNAFLFSSNLPILRYPLQFPIFQNVFVDCYQYLHCTY